MGVAFAARNDQRLSVEDSMMRCLAILIALALAAPSFAQESSLDPRIVNALYDDDYSAVFSTGPAALWIPWRGGNSVDLVGGLAPTNAAQPILSDDGWTFGGGVHLDYGYAAVLEPRTNAYSMAAWIKIPNYAGLHGIIGKSVYGGADRWSLHVDAGKILYLLEASTVKTIQGNPTTTNAWMFVACTTPASPPSNWVSNLYIDGAFVGACSNETTESVDYTGRITAPFRIGSYALSNGSPGNFITGVVGLCAFWRKALTAEQIAQLYYRTHP